jgi:hypothetical protein
VARKINVTQLRVGPEFDRSQDRHDLKGDQIIPEDSPPFQCFLIRRLHNLETTVCHRVDPARVVRNPFGQQSAAPFKPFPNKFRVPKCLDNHKEHETTRSAERLGWLKIPRICRQCGLDRR